MVADHDRAGAVEARYFFRLAENLFFEFGFFRSSLFSQHKGDGGNVCAFRPGPGLPPGGERAEFFIVLLHGGRVFPCSCVLQRFRVLPFGGHDPDISVCFPDDSFKGTVFLRARAHQHAVKGRRGKSRPAWFGNVFPRSYAVVFLPVKEVVNVVRRQVVQADSEFPACLIAEPDPFSFHAFVVRADDFRQFRGQLGKPFLKFPVQVVRILRQGEEGIFPHGGVQHIGLFHVQAVAPFLSPVNGGIPDDGKGVRSQLIRFRLQAFVRHGPDDPLDAFRQQVFRVQVVQRFQPGVSQQMVPSVPPPGDAVIQGTAVFGILGWSEPEEHVIYPL